ncbi:hypothetical protein [Nocardia grenadensis]|uniref:hypothetical protein n=1 Tax=Nocardia grenadensis TaxID=931537 RepID=UPI000A81A5A4|nr:hypothetical protein [Nocardia grenadensis]
MTAVKSNHLPVPVVVDLSVAALRARLHDALAVYIAAMDYPHGTEHHRAPMWTEHTHRAGWHAVAAVVPEDNGELRGLRGAHLLNDETVAVALAQRTTAHGRAAYLACGAGILVVWPGGTLLGGLLGSAVPDPGVFGVDAVFPAVLLGLIMPALHEPAVRRGALTGGVLALLTTALLPPGLPVLLAAVAAALTIPRRGSP